jgi:periplasmic protein TonB
MQQLAMSHIGNAPPAPRAAALGVTVLLHILMVAALLQYQPVRTAITHAVPMMVSLIALEPEVQKTHDAAKPLPVNIPQVAPQLPPPIQIAEAPVPAPAPVVQQTAPVISPPPAPVAVTKPLPITPPNYLADYLDNPPPAYPPVSRRMSEQGKVMLRVLVNVAGTPDRVEIKASSGSSRLDDAALEAVRHWRFVPARQGDQAIAEWVLVPITFSLRA